MRFVGFVGLSRLAHERQGLPLVGIPGLHPAVFWPGWTGLPRRHRDRGAWVAVEGRSEPAAR
jgi:hypothetical protein